MGAIETAINDMQRSRKYRALIGRTKDLILSRYTIEQIKKLYNGYVNADGNTDGKRPVEEINILTLAGDFMKNSANTGRKFYVDKIEETISLEELMTYSKKQHIAINDLEQAFYEQKEQL